METIFKGQTITRYDVIAALEHFDALYDNSSEYENWLEKDYYRYAVEYNGRLYPPKHILSQVAESGATDFEGGEQTNRVFRQLGFNVWSKT